MSKETNTQPIHLTAQEFIDAWAGGCKGVKEEDGKGYWDWFGTVKFKNIVVEDWVEINKIKLLPSIEIRDSTIETLIIQNVQLGDFFSESTNIEYFSTANSQFDSIQLNRNKAFLRLSFNSTVINNINIQYSILEHLQIGNETVVKNKTKIEGSQLYLLRLSGNVSKEITIKKSYLQTFEWEQYTFCKLDIDDCKFESLIFQKTIIPKDSVFQISNCFAKKVIFDQFVNTSWLNISGLKPLKTYEKFIRVDIKKLIIEGKLIGKPEKFQFEKVIDQTTTLHFENSDLGKTSFVNCDLSAFDKFYFFNTKMLEAFVVGTELPQQVFLPEAKKNEKYAQERLAFGQFKKISENRGDNVQAAEFLAREMDAYAKQIANQKGKRGERFNLWLNKFSSNWGNDWLRAVLVTLGMNSFCFLLYCLSLGYTLGKDWSVFWKLASYSLEFLNPLRKADFLQSEVTPLARVVDYLSRIIVAYFTYQTIQAFRRFGKK